MSKIYGTGHLYAYIDPTFSHLNVGIYAMHQVSGMLHLLGCLYVKPRPNNHRVPAFLMMGWLIGNLSGGSCTASPLITLCTNQKQCVWLYGEYNPQYKTSQTIISYKRSEIINHKTYLPNFLIVHYDELLACGSS